MNESDRQAELFSAWTVARGVVVQVSRQLVESGGASGPLLIELTGALKAEEMARASFACAAAENLR